MMNTGLITKTWSTAPQQSSLKGDDGKKMSAENPYGDKNIGQVLNEISDPNWIDPSKKPRENKNEMDKDAFFKLMLTQMKNQDPMNPMQSHEMAAQLAQFTSLEQLQNINSNLEGMKKQEAPMADYQALQFIGKEISADSSSIARMKADEKSDLRYNLVNDAQEVKVKIFDSTGSPVKTLVYHDIKKGLNTASWTGFDEHDMRTLPGDYKFTIEAKDNQGRIVGSTTDVAGKITGVQYSAKGPVLMIGDQSVYLADVKKIVDPKLTAEAKARTASAPQALSKEEIEKMHPSQEALNQPVNMAPAEVKTEAKAGTNAGDRAAEKKKL